MDPQDVGVGIGDARETDQQVEEGMGARHRRVHERQTSKYSGGRADRCMAMHRQTSRRVCLKVER
jgi:hypothetical protein